MNGRTKSYLGSQSGLTMIEVLIALGVLAIIMAMNSQLLTDMIRGSTRENAIVTTQMETTLGLEIMRTDIGNAGLGLPDNMPVSYTEAASVETVAALFNDNATAVPGGVPRALIHSNNDATPVGPLPYIPNSDYLVVKSPAVGGNAAANKWTYITSVDTHQWGVPSLDLNAGDHMVVIRPRTSPLDISQLVVNGTVFNAPYANPMATVAFIPTVAQERFMAYGIKEKESPDVLPRMPFNRADFYVIRRPQDNPNCASGTGSLVKATVNHADGRLDVSPLVTCVANMQVTFRLDRNGDGSPDVTVNTLADATGTALTALQIKQQVKEVRVYVLAHEGPRDNAYRHETQTITVGDPTDGLGKNVDLLSVVGSASWRNYRWKLYSLIVKPRSLY
jgi:prepilin-type N-terminal cleavage/methylation domain-containing protein